MQGLTMGNSSINLRSTIRSSRDLGILTAEIENTTRFSGIKDKDLGTWKTGHLTGYMCDYSMTSHVIYDIFSFSISLNSYLRKEKRKFLE